MTKEELFNYIDGNKTVVVPKTEVKNSNIEIYEGDVKPNREIIKKGTAWLDEGKLVYIGSEGITEVGLSGEEFDDESEIIDLLKELSFDVRKGFRGDMYQDVMLETKRYTREQEESGQSEMKREFKL